LKDGLIGFLTALADQVPRFTARVEIPRSPQGSVAEFFFGPAAQNLLRVSCSHTAEAGRISRGALAPQRSAPAQFFA